MKTRIIFACNDFLVGGAQRLIADTLVHLDREQFEPYVLTLFTFPKKATMYDLIPKDVPVIALSFKGFRDWRNWLRLYRELKRIQPDIVISNLFFCDTLIRILSLPLWYRTIAVIHNTYYNKSRAEILVDWVLSWITYKIVAVSNTVATFTSKQEKIPRGRFSVIHSGIDTQRLHAAVQTHTKAEWKQKLGFEPAQKIILNVARLVKQKNQQLLIRAFSLLNDGSVLLIAGEGNQEARLRSVAKEMGCIDRVFFLGNRTDVEPLYGAADFLVSTSLIEGFCIAHAEALACGVPVLTTKTGGTDEMIIDGKNGFFVEPTEESVLEGIKKMATFIPTTNPRESVRQFDIRIATGKYESLINETFPSPLQDHHESPIYSF